MEEDLHRLAFPLALAAITPAQVESAALFLHVILHEAPEIFVAAS